MGAHGVIRRGAGSRWQRVGMIPSARLGPPRGSSRSGGWQQPRAGSRTDHGPLADGTRPMLEPQVGRAAWLVCAGRDARG